MKLQDKKIYRVLDANLNRLKEGLRVCEDLFRFVYENKHLTAEFKKIRHDVTSVLLKLPLSYQKIVEERDIQKDSGKASAIRDKKKESFSDVFLKNMKRSQESLRVCEEVTKLVDQQSASRFQKIRFRLYDLEKKALTRI